MTPRDPIAQHLRRSRRRLREVVVGTAAALLAFGAVPGVLAVAVGLPVPARWTGTGVVSWRGLFDLLAAIAWVAWAACAWPLLRAVARRVRARDTAVTPGDRLVDRLALRIAAAVLALAPALGATAMAVAGASAAVPTAMATAAAPAGARSPEGGSDPRLGGGADDPTTPHPATSAAASTPASTAWTVEPGDTLWSIAVATSGVGADWLAIANANLGRTMDDGTVFVDPSLIRPGWVLDVPHTGAPAEPAVTSPAAAAGATPTTASTPARGPTPTATPTATPAPASSSTPAQGPTPAATPAPASPSTPPSATTPASASASLSDPTAAATPVSTPVSPSNPAPAAAARPVGVRPARSEVPTGSMAPDRQPAGAPTRPDDHAGRSAARSGTRGAPWDPAPLPALAVMGCGALVAALLARRVRRDRRLASFMRQEGESSDAPGPAAAALATAVDQLADLPLMTMVERAWLRLSDDFADGADPAGGSTKVRIVRAGPDGVEVRLHPGTSVGRGPAGWTPCGTGAWILPAPASTGSARSLGEGRGRFLPWCPLLLPLGDNEAGTWLVPLAAGDSLAVVGPGGQRMIDTLCAAVSSWPWHEDVVITADPDAAARSAGLGGDPRPGDGATSVLFVGDPRHLPPGVPARCAVLTVAPDAGSDLTVVADARGATVHPLGIVVRPHRMTDLAAAAVEQLWTTAAAARTGGAAVTPEPDAADTPGEAPAPATTSVAGRGGAIAGPPATTSAGPPYRAVTSPPVTGPNGAPPRPLALTLPTGQVTRRTPAPSGIPATLSGPDRRPGTQVRLLTSLPRIDGLAAALDPKRARRAVELVAYLGIWHPDPVTGERLRARVLGSADADAAAKTLFNTAGAARRAMGFDDQGRHLLPPASRSGHYRLSPEVSVDAVRAADLIAGAMAAGDGAESADLVVRALSLIEGEPLAGVLAGYGWWRGEGHERRLSDVVVDGTCRLVRAAVESGELDLARWALDRARLVESYSEALSRAAMVVAASAGDGRRLQREWDDCRRLMDELDPGGLPSDASARLYERLRRQLSSGEPAVAGV